MKTFKRARPLLGTFVEIAIQAQSEDVAHSAIDKAFETIYQIENLLSIYKNTSEVSKLNNSTPEVPIKINPLTMEVLKIAQSISKLSNGIFDVVTNKMPETKTTFKNIEFKSTETVLFNKKLQLDFGGIGKGFAVDKTIESLLSSDISQGGINAGGDLRVFGNTPQPIYIRSPKEPSKIFKLKNISNCAVATSANYYRKTKSSGGKDIGIINPSNGKCWNSNKSISIISKTCAVSDALTKVVALLDDTKSTDILNKLSAEAIIVDF